MTMVRMTEQGLEKRRARIAHLKAEIEKLREAQAGRDAPFWKNGLGPALRLTLQATRERIEDIITQPVRDKDAEFADLRGLGGVLNLAKSLIKSVEETEGVLERKYAEVKRLEVEVEEGLKQLAA